MSEGKLLNYLRERLSDYRMILATKRELELRLQELDETIGLKAITYAENSGGVTGTSNKIQDEALKLISLKQEIEMTIEHKRLEVNRISNALSILSPEEKRVIDLKHLQEYRWENVAVIISRSEKTCKRIERKALLRMLKVIQYN